MNNPQQHRTNLCIRVRIEKTVYDVVADHSFQLIYGFKRKTPRPLKLLSFFKKIIDYGAFKQEYIICELLPGLILTVWYAPR
jgi:hypothetical protein